MNLIETFQDLVAQVPELVQPLIIAAAGAIPFIEGEGAVSIGILGGINPIVAAIAAIVGNFLCVAVLVLLSSRAHHAVANRHRAKAQARERVLAGGGDVQDAGATEPQTDRRSVRAQKFQKAFERYGVPGVSLLGPLLLPTQFTATMLAAAGIGRARILFWQGLAIAGWTTIVAVLITGVASAVV